MNTVIGIDTGGTCTDAVLYDMESGRVLDSHKALTTHAHLTDGILAALDGLDPDLARSAKAAGISTTLATNACVEGKFRRPRLLLMGIDRTGIERYGADYGFTDPDDIRYLKCRTTITGQVLEEPDWELLRQNAEEWFTGAEGCAVCEIYGIRNGGVLEKKAARIIEERTGLPVVCSSSLFGGLSSLERAASAVLNAGLLPITAEFLNAVTEAFRARGIHAKIYLVRSDSSLMSLPYSYGHAVETLLSGPASSALGGCIMTAKERAVVVDMGGTTTDVALIDHGRPVLSEDGIRVGKWRTQVNGLFASSFALGGDSVIRSDSSRCLSLGPERVIPLCVLASSHPEIKEKLEKVLRKYPAHTLPLHEFLTLGRRDFRTIPMSENERKLCCRLESGPLNIIEAADFLGTDKYNLDTSSLEKSGVILRAGLTPTDMMHLRGDFCQYDRGASLIAARFVAGAMHTTAPDLCSQVYETISERIFFAVSELLLTQENLHFRRHGITDEIRELFRHQWETRKEDDRSFLDCAFHANVPLIGIGGPIRLFLKDAADALRTDCIVPDFAPVANAVGAVTGKMSASCEAEIRPHGLSPEGEEKGDFELVCPGIPPKYFSGENEAEEWINLHLTERMRKQLIEQGASGAIRTFTNSNVITAPVNGIRVYIATKVRVTAETSLAAAAE